MKIIAVNGSPRKKWNTHMLLEKALEGAKAAGADTELVNLYDLSFKGCVSCFACKHKDVIVDRCVIKDNLLPVLDSICNCDGLILGSPVYFGEVTGLMRCFIERLFFPYLSYEGKPSSFKKKIATSFIYTMNVPESYLDDVGYNKVFTANKELLERIFVAESKKLVVTETYQFDDYSKYAMSMFDGKQRKERRENVFPADCEKAFEMGKNMLSY